MSILLCAVVTYTQYIPSMQRVYVNVGKLWCEISIEVQSHTLCTLDTLIEYITFEHSEYIIHHDQTKYN